MVTFIKEIIELVIIIAVILVIQYIRFNFCYRYIGETSKLSFKEVASIYKVNPDRWHYSRVAKSPSDFFTRTIKILLYNANEPLVWPDLTVHKSYYSWHDTLSLNAKIIRIHLSFFDWVKLGYCYLFKQPNQTKGTEMILETAQQDINKLRDMANKEIMCADEDMKTILKKNTEKRE